VTALRTAAAALLALAATAPAAPAAPRIKVVKLAVTNPQDAPRTAEDVVLRVADLRRVAPDLSAGSVIVTMTDTGTLEDDARVFAARGLPSQADDLDGDGTVDEIAFQVPLPAHATRIVTLAYGDAATLARLRAAYPARTRAVLLADGKGAAWESESYAWRLPADGSGLELLGKPRPGLALDMGNPHGRVIARDPDGIGIGGLAARVATSTARFGYSGAREVRIVSSGPVRGIIEVRYEDVAGQTWGLTSRIVQWAGERGFEHHLHLDTTEPPLILTGLPRVPGQQVVRERRGGVAVLQEWSAQDGVGLAVLGPGAPDGGEGPQWLEQPLALEHGTARWYVLAGWAEEGAERMAGRGLEALVLPAPGGALASRAAFVDAVNARADQIGAPGVVTILSREAAPQPAPPSTLAPARAKTFREAIDLLRQSSEVTAEKWLPRLQREGNAIERSAGDGYFMEADAETGEWKGRDGYNWTGSFWVAMLWRFYDLTRDARFRTWAEAWNAPMLGQEPTQNHDTGFLNFYGSAQSYARTKQAKYKESVLRSAARLEQLFHPEVGLISTVHDGNDTIMDTMINLEVLWWAAKETGQPKWRDIGRWHAQKALEWLVRGDGSIFQSVHYRLGDAAHIRLSAGRDYPLPATVKRGDWAFKHTHQGFAADTSWSRGTAWALYGFARAYQETGEPAFLDAARRVAAFVMDRLPDDHVPWYDYFDEGVLYRNRDTSAAAINAAGLLRLAEAVADKKAAKVYRDEARATVQSLIDRYLTPVAAGDKAPPGYLRHGCGTSPQDGPLIFGHYYLLEALMQLDREARH
jgi:unsaturated chondroitin disaccharide hydrolase